MQISGTLTVSRKKMDSALRRCTEITILRVLRRMSSRIKVYYTAWDPRALVLEKVSLRGESDEEMPCSALRNA